MLSASKSIMALAALKHGVQKQQQKQVVNVNVQQPPITVQYPAPYEIDENITVVPVTPITQPQPPTQPQPTVQTRSVTDTNTLDELLEMLNNSENVAKALIMIIDIMQSNPLIINKLIVPYKQPFIDLVQTLTGADDVDIQFNEDVSCTASKKYHLIEDIYVVKSGETQSLKYTYPEVLRLFDRFKISSKMIAV
jgi:hypothetical protein